ncbi:Uu.00g077870.m01.CDS01 [Anthostomella pinea]|uniref:Uu.00g077870.m01.CDS01 n=1 Tax=Anthostomella pinea TaxID=933095 RepID=A0AAI8YIZ3_9PEZI|nr:Uu.00g077870.m01.CDS01 [Anthostomella pinea]
MSPLSRVSLAVSAITHRDDLVAPDHGFANNCQSWHVEPSPDNTALNLVAMCPSTMYLASGSQDDVLCTSLDMNRCFYNADSVPTLIGSPSSWGPYSQVFQLYPKTCRSPLLATDEDSPVTKSNTILQIECLGHAAWANTFQTTMGAYVANLLPLMGTSPRIAAEAGRFGLRRGGVIYEG